MRVYLIACLATVVIAVGGLYALFSIQKSSGIVYQGDGARIEPRWTLRQMVTRPKAAPQNVSMVIPASLDVANDDCSVSSAWAWIMADFKTSATAEPSCDH
jgi:hypothetical protein